MTTIDDRLHAMFSELSPGVIIAVLSSFRRLGLSRSCIPKTSDSLVTEVSSLACTLDVRTFLLSMRALFELGFTWESLSNDQRLGVVSGIARSASANPSKLASILTVLVNFKASWKDIHEKIPIVLRYVVFKVFSTIGTSSSLSSEERITTLHFIDNILHIFAEMRASWTFIGDKAAITILQSLSVLKLTREEQASSFNDLSVVFSDIPDHVFEAVPLEFHYLFHLNASRDERRSAAGDLQIVKKET